MTVIMGATFVGGVVIAADTLLHDPTTHATVMNSAKTLAVGKRMAIAQAGEFTGTVGVWDALAALDPSTASLETVVYCIRHHAGEIHAARVASGGSLETTYLVGGLGDDGQPVLASIEIAKDEVKVFPGPGQIVAIGTQENTTDVATVALRASLKPWSNVAKLDEWVRSVVTYEATKAPKFVGFPATMVIVRRDSPIEAQVELVGLHDARLEGFFP